MTKTTMVLVAAALPLVVEAQIVVPAGQRAALPATQTAAQSQNPPSPRGQRPAKPPRRAATQRPAKTQRDSLSLSEREHLLGDVVVTTTHRERPTKDEPVVTHVFTAREIEKLAAPSFQDVLTNLIPGIQFETQRGASPGTQSIRLQGLGGSYVLFLLDGEPISSKNGENWIKPRAGQIDFSRIDPNNIERIEYLPSGGSILYGSNSIGGVVNIISKKTSRPRQLQVGTRISLPQQQRYELNAGISSKKTRLRFNTSLTNNRPYEAYTDEKGQPVTLPASRLFTAATNATLRPNEALRLNLGANFSSTHLNLSPEGTPPMGRNYDTRSGGARAAAQWQLSPKQSLDLSLSADLAGRDIEALGADGSLALSQRDYRNSLLGARLQYTLTHSDQHSTMAGFEDNAEHIVSQSLRDKEEGHRQNTAVLYAQHDANFFRRRLFVSYGLRMDHNSTFGTELLQRLSLMQKIGPVDLRLLYSESFRSPTLTERFALVEDPSGRFAYEGNPDLQPEKSRRYTLQVGYTTPRLSLSASGYRAEVSNLIQNQRFDNPKAAGGYVLRGVNTDKSVRMLGSEVLLRVQSAAGLYGQATYSYTASVSRTVRDIRGRSYNTSLVRPHALSGLVGYSLPRRHYQLDLNLSARYMARVSYYSVKTSSTDTHGAPEITVRDERGQDGFLTYYNIVEDAYSNVRLAANLKFCKAYTLGLGVDNLLGFRSNATNFTSALTNGRQFFASLHIDIDKLWRK